jgi:hypothetical protein
MGLYPAAAVLLALNRTRICNSSGVLVEHRKVLAQDFWVFLRHADRLEASEGALILPRCHLALMPAHTGSVLRAERRQYPAHHDV